MRSQQLLFVCIGIFFLLSTSFIIAANPDTSSPSYYLVTYDSTQSASVQQQLQDFFGEDIIGYIHPHHYIIYAPEDKLTSLREQGILSDYRLYRDSFDLVLPLPSSFDHYEVHLFQSHDASRVQQFFLDHAVTPLSAADTVITVPATTDISLLKNIEGVSSISASQTFAVTNNQVNSISGTPLTQLNLKLFGKQQIIAITDTGLDTGVNDPSMHDDLEGRILSLTNLVPTRLPQPWDKNGHGTHVAGSALGSGILSGSNPSQNQFFNSFAGSAPGAQLIFQAIGDDQGSLYVYPPYPYSSLIFLPTYQQGARIHSNSWNAQGSVFYGMYENTARDVDIFATQHKDMVVLFSAGNDGYNGPGTVLPPSTAKNILTVGSVDTTNPGQVSSFSGRGPTLDGRFKPDVVAPGTAVISTKSSLSRNCTVYQQNQNYCLMTGTSMATPHVAGLLALIREYYATYRQHSQPSAALLKATLFIGADSFSASAPSFQSGWGRVNIAMSLAGQPQSLVFRDVPVSQGLTTGNMQQYPLSVKAGQPFEIVLTWTDVEGMVLPLNATKLVNDLDLVITDPQGKQYMGNDVTAPYNDQPDHVNTAESVLIPTPATGIYIVTVKGFNVPKGVQDYAFVAQYKQKDVSVSSPTGMSITGQPIQLFQPKLCVLPNGSPC